MASVTIKDIPEELLERLRARAAADQRSMAKEIVYLLDQAMSESPAPDVSALAREAQTQADAWSRLAGRWRSDRSVAEEVQDLYASRSTGREVDL